METSPMSPTNWMDSKPTKYYNKENTLVRSTLNVLNRLEAIQEEDGLRRISIIVRELVS